MKLLPNNLRKHVLKMVYEKGSGHIGGSFSIAELTCYLYNEFDIINKDKLILSKGHAVPILYAALFEMGLIKDLSNFREVNSPLQGHPDKQRLKCCRISPEMETNLHNFRYYQRQGSFFYGDSRMARQGS